jgi:hypothetical protein
MMLALTSSCRAQRWNLRARASRWPGVSNAVSSSNSGSNMTGQ